MAGSAGMGTGGASGVTPSIQLGMLSASDKQKLCAWGQTLPGIGVEMRCPDGSTVEAEVLSGAECIQSLDDAAGCTATVGEFEGCIYGQQKKPCEFFISECDPIFACLM